MHIRDFHLKLISSTEECGLLDALRRLSRLESPQAMIGDGGTTSAEWTIWTEAGNGSSLSSALVTA
jgi:hypothetical protein